MLFFRNKCTHVHRRRQCYVSKERYTASRHGVYTISFQARHIPAGFVEIELRGVDVYGQVTIIKHNIIIESENTNIGSDPSQGIIELLSNPVVIFSLLFALVGIVAIVVIFLKKNGVSFGNFGED